MKHNTFLVVGVAASLLIGLTALFMGGEIRTIETVKEVAFGSASSPSIVDGCMDVNGVSICAYSQQFTNASTTCSFSPKLASSTLIHAAATVINPRGGTFAVEIGKARTAYATTTQFAYFSGVNVGGTFSVHASSTGLLLGERDSAKNFTQGDYLNVKVGSTTFSGTGKCSSLFMST